VRFVGSTGSTLQYVVLILVETRRIRSPVQYGSRRGYRSGGGKGGELSGWNRGLTFAWCRRIHTSESTDYLRAIEPAATSGNGALTDFRGASL
jgi:hypothetical protein